MTSASQFHRIVRAARPGWFTSLLCLLGPLFAPLALAVAQSRARWDQFVPPLMAAALLATGPGARRLFVGLYPCGLVWALYDGMRYVQNVGLTPGRVHLCDLRDRELALFGVSMNGERVTLQDWFRAHHAPVLDLLCAIPYGAFVVVVLAAALFLYVRDYPRMVRFGWCWLALNVAGFVTYHLYPAAPPWYWHAHGCTVHLAARPSKGPALARVDALLGVHYFHGMYGRATDVFGAMPSLHCAYALIVVLEPWPLLGVGWRIAGAAFLSTMCFSAVYLDHHWVLDVVAGLVYCLLVVGAVRALSTAWASPSPRAVLNVEAETTGGAP